MEKIIGDLEKQIETLKDENEVLKSQNMDLAVERKRTSKAVGKNLELIEENTKLKELLREVESQLNDRGGFDILRASINEVITS